MNAGPKSFQADTPHPLQVQAWRTMGATGRSELAAALRRQARGWKRDGLRAQHPDWNDERIERELARIYLRAHT
jgi:hypothetical protein